MKKKTEHVGDLGNKQNFGSLFITMICNFEFHFHFIFIFFSLRKWRISEQVAEIQRVGILQMSRAQVSSDILFSVWLPRSGRKLSDEKKFIFQKPNEGFGDTLWKENLVCFI